VLALELEPVLGPEQAPERALELDCYSLQRQNYSAIRVGFLRRFQRLFLYPKAWLILRYADHVCCQD
jgi:hypothetical protein